jgi:hypothetical protein
MRGEPPEVPGVEPWNTVEKWRGHVPSLTSAASSRISEKPASVPGSRPGACPGRVPGPWRTR